MPATKADIIAQLKMDILPLQGIRMAFTNPATDAKLGTITNAFPGNTFPVGAIHEFISFKPEDSAATIGFIATIIGSLMKKTGAALWISPVKTIFPPALSSFGIAPE